MKVRAATEADLPAILEIYNASIATTSTWSERVQTMAERQAWFSVRSAKGDGVVVAEDAGVVVGFAAYGDFRDTDHWPGYRFTVENTVHVRDGHFGQGIGRTLMEALIDHAAANGKHSMIAAVDGENDGSVTFHESLGFEVVGRLPELGWKFEHWLDLVLLQRMLD